MIGFVIGVAVGAIGVVCIALCQASRSGRSDEFNWHDYDEWGK